MSPLCTRYFTRWYMCNIFTWPSPLWGEGLTQKSWGLRIFLPNQNYQKNVNNFSGYGGKIQSYSWDPSVPHIMEQPGRRQDYWSRWGLGRGTCHLRRKPPHLPPTPQFQPSHSSMKEQSWASWKFWDSKYCQQAQRFAGRLENLRVRGCLLPHHGVRTDL